MIYEVQRSSRAEARKEELSKQEIEVININHILRQQPFLLFGELRSQNQKKGTERKRFEIDVKLTILTSACSRGWPQVALALNLPFGRL